MALNQESLRKLAECFGLDSVSYSAIVSAAAKSPFLAEELDTF